VDGDLTLVGVGDLWSGEFDVQRAFERVAPDAAVLVLCHNPDGKQPLAAFSWQLMLSGHTHGGQGCIPGISPVWAPVSDKRFIAGLYGWEGRQLFITRGLGCSQARSRILPAGGLDP
jgi:predicted MPP superfamily phosphohydrolase